MSITPNELLEQEFSVRFRGYDRQEVNSFLEEVANFLAHVIKERNELRDKILRYQKQISLLKQQESEFRKALTTAHQMAEEMKISAQKDADLIIERAKLEADRIVADAHQEAIQLEDRIRKLRMLQRESVHKMRSSFEGFLRILDDEMMLPPEEIDEALRVTADQIRAIQDEEPGPRQELVSGHGREKSDKGDRTTVYEQRPNAHDIPEPDMTSDQEEDYGFEPGKLWPED